MTDTAKPSQPGGVEGRPLNSTLYPWYDSVWLCRYEEAKATLRMKRPEALSKFVDGFRILRTRPDFRVKCLEQPFDNDTFAEIRRVTASLQPTDLELHEARQFGRFIVHNHPFFAQLQERVVDYASDLAGEPLESGYNFLSLYTSKGVCAVHMDAPEAKWTLDFCIDQAAPWPIYLSAVQPWPDANEAAWKGEGWDDQIKKSRSLEFTPFILEPGKAIFFSGSSQWHYRDPLPEAGGKQFCTLLFFHFIPKGTAELIQPKNWARLFDLPELRGLSYEIEPPVKVAQRESTLPAAGCSAASAASGASKRA